MSPAHRLRGGGALAPRAERGARRSRERARRARSRRADTRSAARCPPTRGVLAHPACPPLQPAGDVTLSLPHGELRGRFLAGALAPRVGLRLLDLPELYARPGLYGDARGGYWDNGLRFIALARAATARCGRAASGRARRARLARRARALPDANAGRRALARRRQRARDPQQRAPGSLPGLGLRVDRRATPSISSPTGSSSSAISRCSRRGSSSRTGSSPSRRATPASCSSQPSAWASRASIAGARRASPASRTGSTCSATTRPPTRRSRRPSMPSTPAARSPAAPPC